MSEKGLIIAIDGPAGSGKSTTARNVADELGYVYIDTGAMYRAVALAALRHGADTQESALADVVANIAIEIKPSQNGQQTYLNGENISEEIRSPQVTNRVSSIAALKSVREALVKLQRVMGRNGSVVMDGRDIGTNVFPHADVKIFLIASADERARRRAAEMTAKGLDVDTAELREQILLRDKQDSERAVDPLKKADDAIVVDTSDLTIAGQTRIILDYIRQKQRSREK